MNKIAILFILNPFLAISHCFSQEITPFRVQEKCGFTVKDASGKVISHVDATFNGLRIHANSVLNTDLTLYMDFGDNLWSNFVDTIFTESPCHKDSADDCYNVDTSVVYGRKFFNKNIMALRKKWGLIDYKGNVILPFIYDSILVYRRHFLPNSKDSEYKLPYLLLFKNNKMAVCDNKGKIILNENIQQIINKNISAKVKYDILDFTLIGKNLLVAKDAVYYDSSFVKITKNAEIGIVNNDTMYYDHFIRINNKGFVGGSYNVLNLETGKYIFEKWQKKVVVKISSRYKDNNYYILDITNGNSITEYLDNFQHTEILEGYNITFETAK